MLLSQLPRQLPFPLAKNLNPNLLNRKGAKLSFAPFLGFDCYIEINSLCNHNLMTFATTASPTHTNFKIRDDILDLQASLVQWRRDFHRFPELGFKEKRTSSAIAEKLTAWGIPHQTAIAETGIVATIAGTKLGNGKVLAIRADMDALPIQEENIVSYKSQIDGLMHACGHDGHTAIALGTAKYLWEHRDRFSGTVKIIFQPAEEGPGGAKPMIEAGVLENPKVDAVIGLHIWNN